MNRKLIAPVLLMASALGFLLISGRDAQAQTTAPPCTAPGISFWKLLDAVGVGYADGRLRIDKLYAVCLPAPAKQSTSNYPYDPDVGGKLTTLVKTAAELSSRNSWPCLSSPVVVGQRTRGTPPGDPEYSRMRRLSIHELPEIVTHSL